MKNVGVDWFSLDPDEIKRYAGTARGIFTVPGMKIGGSPASGAYRVTVHRSHLPLLPGALPKTLPGNKHVLPKASRGWLRPFQLEAVEWLRQRGGAILALDLGGGKTATATAAADLPVVIGVPVSVIDVWRTECARLGWSYLVCRDVQELKDALKVDACEAYILPYSQADKLAGYFTPYRVGTLILDEAHIMTNKYVTWSQAFRGLPRDRTLLLTATPMRNRLVSLWGLLDVANPGAYGGKNSFRERYCGGIPGAYGGMVDTEATNQMELAQRLTESVYKLTREDMRIALPDHVRKVHEARVFSPFPSLDEILKGISAPTGAHLIILGEMRQHLSKEKVLNLDLRNTLDSGYRVVFWVWYKETAKILERRLNELGIPTDVMLGDAPTKKRTTILKEWGRPPRAQGDERALIASIAAAGTGISLSNARLAVFIDLDWTPLNIIQAEKRHDRFGNYWPSIETWYEIVPGTVDELMVEALIEKQRDSETSLGRDGTLNQMIQLLGEGAEPQTGQEIICSMAERMLKNEKSTKEIWK